MLRRFNDAVLCPYCNSVVDVDDLWIELEEQDFGDDPIEDECPECGKNILIDREVEINIQYKIKPLDGCCGTVYKEIGNPPVKYWSRCCKDVEEGETLCEACARVAIEKEGQGRLL